MQKTDKYQGGVEVTVMLLSELLVIIFCFFVICFKEMRPIMLRRWQ